MLAVSIMTAPPPDEESFTPPAPTSVRLPALDFRPLLPPNTVISLNVTLEEVSIFCGAERVMAPVEDEAMIWWAVPVILVTAPELPLDAAVIRPFALTVIFALVKEPTFELTVARAVT